MRLTAALQKYLVQMEADGRSPLTIDQNRRYVLWLDRWLASERRSRDLARIDHETLAAFLVSDDVRKQADGTPKKETSVNTLRSSLRSFFGYAHAIGLTPVNAAAVVRRARCESPPPHALSEDECRRLLAAVADGTGATAKRDRMLFGLMLGTGARVSSVLALSSDDVDLARGELRLRATKGGVPAVLFLSKALQRDLRAYLRSRAPGLLFPGEGGRPLNRRSAQGRLTLWLGRAGVTHGSLHSLRHSFAMAMLRKTGGDVLLVQQAMHHRSVQSTMQYLQMDEDRLREALR
jgi:site-specific recombinase XerD